MGNIPILINLDKKTFKELHDIMGMKLEVNDITVHRIFEGKSKQQFYREIIRAGMTSKLLEFEKRKKELENENKNDYRG